VAVTRSVDRAVFGVVFLLVFVFSYSYEIAGGFFDAIGYGDRRELWIVTVFVLQALIVGATAILKRSIARGDGRGPRLWRWWFAALAIVVVNDVVVFVAESDGNSISVDILTATVFIVAIAIIMLSSLNADPLVLFSGARRAALPADWLRARAVVPLIVGAYAAYLGATAWSDYFGLGALRTLDEAQAAELAQLSLFERENLLETICDPGIASTYFEQVAQIIPLLLITLGIEFGFFRASLREPAQRAATTATVVLMSIGLMGAVSTLPWRNDECGQILAGWHEYLTFVFSLQAIFTGLITLVWLLIVNVPNSGETTAES
jgi:hypothetical protein